MEDSATLALVIQFVAGCIASFLVLRRVAGLLAAVVIGMCGSTIGGFLLPQPLTGLGNNQLLTGLENDQLDFVIASVIGALITAGLLRLVILYNIRRDS